MKFINTRIPLTKICLVYKNKELGMLRNGRSKTTKPFISLHKTLANLLSKIKRTIKDVLMLLNHGERKEKR